MNVQVRRQQLRVRGGDGPVAIGLDRDVVGAQLGSQPGVRVVGSDDTRARPELRDAALVCLDVLAESMTECGLGHRVEHHRPVDTDGFLGRVEVLVFLAERLVGSCVVALGQVLGAFAAGMVGAAGPEALCSTQHGGIGAAVDNLVGRVDDQVVHLVAAHRGQCGARLGCADPVGHEAAGVAVRPDTPDDTDRVDGGPEPGGAAAVVERGLGAAGHQIDRFGAEIAIVDLAGADDHGGAGVDAVGERVGHVVIASSPSSSTNWL
jgi:hypothetical protein